MGWEGEGAPGSVSGLWSSFIERQSLSLMRSLEKRTRAGLFKYFYPCPSYYRPPKTTFGAQLMCIEFTSVLKRAWNDEAVDVTWRQEMVDMVGPRKGGFLPVKGVLRAGE